MKPAFKIYAFIVVGILCGSNLFACANPPEDIIPTLAPTALLSPASTATTPTAQPANTAVPPTATPLPSPTPCQYAVQPDLIAAWSPDELGCPITPGSAAINTAYAPFEGGQMLWRGDTDTVYVLTNDGRWMSYANEWQPGDPEYACGEESSPPTPLRGFGRVWCDHPDVRDALGAVTAAEIGDSAGVVQEFVNGTILTAPFGSLFVFVGEDSVWRQVEQ